MKAYGSGACGSCLTRRPVSWSPLSTLHCGTGVGTGGTISGTGRFLKEKKPSVQVGADVDGTPPEMHLQASVVGVSL